MLRIPAPLLVIAATVTAWATPAAAKDPPYWATITVDELNMRVGPSLQYRIDWVYRRQGLPVMVVRQREGWRLIRDPDGAQGWVVARFLSPERGAIVQGDGLAPIRDAPGSAARVLWRAEPGVVGKLGACEAGWCQFAIGEREGFIEEDRLWGTEEP